ncbi:ribosomal 5S rRNA E-loop binding protein Ctc/L25/TL5 [Hahella chejuensis KCTC 2396]|uniref:Large ribosomal subunit protein bL25 n=1 Tax=Hahella chejuensis (strain KCTC 2396) TaxID=349521 RepID=RL25_HAHCH|nr:50S ribosomal protein L25/general stress protein Ctc [Hahella chejuensis]Q2SLA2.1 RecName: Full=Large ribosomal subunit protein bL25; AltName: Full=50S ribosomal protein L25; AltName: Full=General stress protein CTC [Hahella chejuensis KCTC 2396]ABC28572.1 ribosomal 5S rRNA E-loop binding protein Ctc/L25/TL5 [Hahella chejuensis KCTC 2396]
MSNEFSLNAEKRDVQGKGASRRLRRVDGKVPGIIYGGETAPVAISVSHNQLSHALQNEAFYSHILTLDVEGTNESVILKDLQRHPYKPIIMHADFLRVQKDQKLHVNVPLHFINEDKCEGVRQGGGSISHQQTEVEVICLPANLPEFIEVDMTSVQVEQILHLSDLKLPEGVELAELTKGSDHDLPVVAVHKPKGAKADEAEGEGEAE